MGLFTWLMVACGPTVVDEDSGMVDPIPDQISYNFHVKPILSDRCFNCHGPDEAKREAGLRLDDPKSSLAELVNSPGKRAIVRGRTSKSELIHRIHAQDPELQMPPPKSKLLLTQREKKILAKWIEQGAKYEEHWAFQVPQDAEIPSRQHPIDYFIDRNLAIKNLTANPPATKESLIRRASFDLTGLPPSIKQIDAFLADEDPKAFQELLDDLLSASTYGERMAAEWMDVARYTDSDGYLDDKHRDFSPYRDWVISAFNDNMPYDQFVTWQLAGDLIPDRTQESILATAFNRLHRKNSEAGIVFEEYRTEYVADRVHTFGKAFLGLTLECARCHDHKYDPISQKEYYELFAFFNSTDEMGTAIYGPDQTPGPSLLLADAEQRKILDFIKREIAEQEDQLKKALPLTIAASDEMICQGVKDELDQKLVAHHSFDNLMFFEQGKWRDKNRASGSTYATVHEPHIVNGVNGKALQVDDYNYALLPDKVGWYDRVDPFSVTLWVMPAEEYEEAGIFTHCEDLRLGYKGYSLHLANNKLRFIMAHSWPFNAIEIISETALVAGRWSHIAVTYDGSSAAEGVALYLDGHRLDVEVVRNNLYKGILYEPNIHTYGFAGFRLGYRDKIKNLKGGAFDEVKIFADQLSSLAIQRDFDPGAFEKKCQESQLPDSTVHHFRFLNEHKSSANLRRQLHNSRSKLNAEINAIPEVMVLGDLATPRPTFILERGAYDAPGDQVTASTPECLGNPTEKKQASRLDLANWLFDRAHPLTARVYVNRLWQLHFGHGLVTTPEDFGAQGSLPSHPELLDHLALTFEVSGWDIKKMHKLIMTSAAYQRHSQQSMKQLDRDPKNEWYAVGPSKKLTAEMIRDNALAISGLLVPTIGGPSVYPYQPDGLWDEVSNKVWRYPYLQQPGPGLYRRSIYTVWKRTVPPPAMLLFDVPDRSFCTVQRKETNTPLQALVLLNDPQYVEAARSLALAAMDQEQGLDSQFDFVFRRILGRAASELEMQAIHSFFEAELDRLVGEPARAKAYLNNGEQKYMGTEQAHLAALSMTAHNLMNSFEAQRSM